jgi:PAS domain S-box-containing protein
MVSASNSKPTKRSYKILVDQLQQGLSVIAMPRARVLYANQAFYGMLGCSDSVDQLNQTVFKRHFKPDDFKKLIESIRKILKSENVRECLTCSVIIDGARYRWVRIELCRVEWNDESCVQVMVNDVNDLEQTKLNLEAVRNQLQATLDAIPGAASWMTSDLTYMGINDKLAELYGKPQSFFIGRKVGFFQPESDFAEFAKNFFLEKHQTQSAEIRITLNGQSRIYLLVGQKYNKGNSAVFVALDITDRKRAEEKVKSSEKAFRRLVEYNPGAIVVHCEGKIVYANSEALRLGGGDKREDLLGQPIERFVHPDYSDLIEKDVHKAQNRGLPGEPIVEKFVSLDGKTIDVEVTAIPTMYHEKPATQVMFRDITKQNESIEIIRKSETLAKALIAKSPTGISIRDRYGRLISVNNAWKKIWGHKEDDLINDFYREPSFPGFDERDSYLKPYFKELRQVYEKGGSLELPEICLTDKQQNGPKWISQYFYALTDQKGNVEQVVILTADITERKEAAEALARKDRILQSVSQVAEILLGTSDLRSGMNDSLSCLGKASEVSRVYVFQNKTSRKGELLTSQIVEWNTQGVKSQQDNPEMKNIPLIRAGYQRWYDTLGKGDVISGLVKEFPACEKPFLNEQGIVSILVVPVFAENKWWGFIGFDHCVKEHQWSLSEIGALRSAAGIIGSTIVRNLREIEIKSINEELEDRIAWRTRDLRNANQALEESLHTLQETYAHLVQSEKLAALGSMVAGIAHEIKTPIGIGVTAASHLAEKTDKFLSQIKLKTESLENLLKFAESSNESARIILANLNRASELIQSFKQVAVDQSSEQKRVFYLKDYFQSVFLSLKPELKKVKNLKVDINCDKSIRLYSRPGVFSQILSNLVLNSIIHGFENRDSGTITIDVSDASPDYLEIAVKDDGKGIPEQNRSNVFEPFFTTARGSGTTAGSGLGLNLVYNLVTKNLKGTITCDSEETVHTTFLIKIPAATDA